MVYRVVVYALQRFTNANDVLCRMAAPTPLQGREAEPLGMPLDEQPPGQAISQPQGTGMQTPSVPSSSGPKAATGYVP